MGPYDYGKAPFLINEEVIFKDVEIFEEQSGDKIEAYEGEVKSDNPEIRHGRGACFY